jgi:hypothetical protein
MSFLLRPKFAALHNRETASSLNENCLLQLRQIL